MRGLVLLLLAGLFLLRYDLWWWDEPKLLLGLPIGLTYHVAYCLVAAAVMAVVVRHAWPKLDLRGNDDA